MFREFIHQLAGILVTVSLVTGSTAFGLRLLKPVPSYIQPKAITQYESVEALESALRLRVPMPSYFPEFLQWPAEEIQAQRYEGLILSFTFLLRKQSGVGLQMYQILSEGEEEQGVMPDFDEVFQPDAEKVVSVGAAKGILRSGKGKNERYWRRLQWRLEDRTVVLLSSSSEKDLLRIARSIHR